MTDFFKSALNIFSNPAQGAKTTSANEFVGQTIVINSQRLRITKQLAEGGYAIVYIAQDVTNGNEYALKVGGLLFHWTGVLLSPTTLTNVKFI
jgi:cyclin G-associated kinase